jgi:hypothetical protein
VDKPYLPIKLEREREREWPRQQRVGCFWFQYAALIQPQDAVLEPKRTPTRYPRMCFQLYSMYICVYIFFYVIIFQLH